MTEYCTFYGYIWNAKKTKATLVVKRKSQRQMSNFLEHRKGRIVKGSLLENERTGTQFVFDFYDEKEDWNHWFRR